MSSQDEEIKIKFQQYLDQHDIKSLSSYFEKLEDKKLSRKLYILSNVFPNFLEISDEECIFIKQIISNPKIQHTSGLLSFLSAISIIHFSEKQKYIIKTVLKENIISISENPSFTFDLDDLLTQVFNPSELFEYMQILLKTNNRDLCSLVENILEYHLDIFENIISSEDIEQLQKTTEEKLKVLYQR